MSLYINTLLKVHYLKFSIPPHLMIFIKTEVESVMQESQNIFCRQLPGQRICTASVLYNTELNFDTLIKTCYVLHIFVHQPNRKRLLRIWTGQDQSMPLTWLNPGEKVLQVWLQGNGNGALICTLRLLIVLLCERPVAKSSHVAKLLPRRHVSPCRESVIVSHDFLQQLCSVDAHCV